MNKVKALFLAVMFSALFCSNASAATFIVDSVSDNGDDNPGDGDCYTANEVCTLRAAIQEANALAGIDIIILPAGTYNLTITGRYEDGSATGDLDINEGVIIQGEGSATTIIDGKGIDRVFHAISGTVDISGVTIKGGNAVLQYGGGIYNYSGTITMTDCKVMLNRADVQAGGIYNYGGVLEITGSTVSGNIAVYLEAYGRGDGGGIYNENGVVTITDSTVSGNIGNGFGWTGGIVNGGFMTIENSTIKNNIAALYAGIDNYGNMTITNSTIINNSSTDDDVWGCRGGAGVINENVITIQNSTIAENAPFNISNGDYDCFLAPGTFIIRNSIVSNTAPGVNCGAIDMPFDSSSKNDLSTDNSCGVPFIQKTASQINLGPLADNGGPTQTMALLAGSVAIDAADAVSCPSVDQRGVTRPQGAHCDIGSFEYSSVSKLDQTITVNPHAPSSAVYNTSFTVSATASSGLGVTITTSGACSGNGTGSATITMTNGTGTCTVKYDQVGNDNYNAAPQITEGATAQKVDQTITVNPHAPASAVYNTSFTVAATGGDSGNPVTYSSAGACTNVGAVFTMTSGTGTCTVKYDQAGNDSYNAATQVTEAVTAQKVDQTITVNPHAPSSSAYNSSFNVSATASSGLGVAITTSGACSGSGTGSATITMSSLMDTCTVLFNQAGDTDYNQAPQVSETTTQYVLTVTTLGTGSGTVSGNGIVCEWDGTSATGTCSFGFGSNDPFNLSSSAGACSFFKEWSAACAGSEGQCGGTMTEPKVVEARFELYPLARLSSAMYGYDTITEVYNNLIEKVIQIQAHEFSEEDLILDLPVDITIEAGWNCDYTQLDGVAGINSLTVLSGALTIQNGGLMIGP